MAALACEQPACPAVRIAGSRLQGAAGAREVGLGGGPALTSERPGTVCMVRGLVPGQLWAVFYSWLVPVGAQVGLRGHIELVAEVAGGIVVRFRIGPAAAAWRRCSLYRDVSG